MAADDGFSTHIQAGDEHPDSFPSTASEVTADTALEWVAAVALGEFLVL